eukprot:TRINITY_DN30445_c0_g1_i1.p1 TRINITY_DN30445_c0_g1~~TRINITY_DN30445_c0_g1_i1.p1  ORF type:complete len:213 (-),score=23.79 TRINITY_DN30445_c0_g1_i1:105-743(-)
MSDNDEVYTVEAVVKHRTVRGNSLEFLIKWKDYPSSENTWEAENDVYAKDLIDEYWIRINEKEKKKSEKSASHSKPRSSTGGSSKRAREPPSTIAIDSDTEEETAAKPPAKVTKVAHSTPTRKPTPPVSDDDEDRLSKEAIEELLKIKNWETKVREIETVHRDEDGGLVLHVRWQSNAISFHKASVVNERCPQKVIKFYEERLTFRAPGEKR